MSSRRNFLKNMAVGGAALAVSPLFSNCKQENQSPVKAESKSPSLIVPKGNGLKITGTFLDEISHDIPHQNWGEKEWDQDFQYMKAIGIDTVIMIRSGYRKFITFPSP